MVSPSKMLQLENGPTSLEAANAHHAGLKNQLAPRSTNPLGDVQNTLAPQRLGHFKAPELKSSKPSDIKQKKCSNTKSLENTNLKPLHAKEEFDPWSDSLTYCDNVPDNYADIIPHYLQLTEKDISRLVMNTGGPRTGVDINQYDDWHNTLEFVSAPEISKVYIEDEYERIANLLNLDDDLPPPVPQLILFDQLI